ncbi:hypothetical protein CCUS01_03040 [Colletotrichum cuscutae]|uniref:Uncharacterized protein n=1 Tax=Colletotrichum cuscutae TaxID=1209917 RepID=A0AAI9YB13_9PEZI|nr:hypothetical protein CCUS01_03040 [Colletotrichum cuscutae]
MAWLSPSLICIPPLPSIFLCFPLLSFLLYLLPRSSSSPSPLSIAVLSSSCKFWVYSSEQSASVLGTYLQGAEPRALCYKKVANIKPKSGYNNAGDKDAEMLMMQCRGSGSP